MVFSSKFHGIIRLYNGKRKSKLIKFNFDNISQYKLFRKNNPSLYITYENHNCFIRIKRIRDGNFVEKLIEMEYSILNENNINA